MWPKTIKIRGIDVQVESLDELDEFIKRYGENVNPQISPPRNQVGQPNKMVGTTISTTDQTMLEKFYKSGDKGLLNKDLGSFFGVEGKSIQPKLREWALKINLTENRDSQVFEATNQSEGRGFKLSEMFRDVAGRMLGQNIADSVGDQERGG